MTVIPTSHYGYRPGRFGIELRSDRRNLKFQSFNTQQAEIENVFLNELISESGLLMLQRVASQSPFFYRHVEALMHLRAATRNLGATTGEPLTSLEIGPTNDLGASELIWELDREISKRALNMGKFLPDDICREWQDIFLAIGYGKDGLLDEKLTMIEYDVFISHASEDKEDLVRPLAEKLADLGYRIWYDEFSLSVGDSLTQSINDGLAKSRYGIVVFSKAFLSKNWPQFELNGLVAREMQGRRIILPIWHNVDYQDMLSYSPSLTDKLALNTQQLSLDEIVEKLVAKIDE